MANENEPELVDLFTASGVLAPESGPWPAIVQSYDAAKGLATCQPTPGVQDYKSRKKIALRPVEVPVAWPGVQGMTIDAELAPGDEVILIPLTPSIRAWLTSGGVTDAQRPGGSLGESVAFPVRLSAPRRPGAPGNVLRLGRDDGTATITMTITGPAEIKVTAPSVEIGASASPKAVARDTDPVNTNATFTTWRTNVEAGILAAGGGIVSPLVGTAIGTVKATSTEVSSS